MLLELFTGKRPTDEMFGGELSLERWVQQSLHENKSIDEVVDRNLLVGGFDLPRAEVCLRSVLCLAMECLAGAPADRVDITTVVKKLERIIAAFRESE